MKTNLITKFGRGTVYGVFGCLLMAMVYMIILFLSMLLNINLLVVNVELRIGLTYFARAGFIGGFIIGLIEK